MDATTGHLYDSYDLAIDAGVDPANIVMLDGPEEAVRAVADKVEQQSQADAEFERRQANLKAQRRAANRRARRSRRRNRG